MQTAASIAVRTYLAGLDRTVSQRPEHGRQRSALVAAATECLSPLGQIRWEPVGSSRCELGLEGLSDVDLVAVFLDPVDHGIDYGILPYSMREMRSAIAAKSELPEPILPHKAYQLFWKRLASMDPVPGYERPVADWPAVTFASRTDQPSVDMVPGVETGFLWRSDATKPSSALVTVAYPATRRRWLGTSPQLHAGVLDQQPGGQDYTCREMIRLVKLIKYRRGIKILSYFIELYAMRWLEGSHDYPATSISNILANAGVTWTRRDPDGYLAHDVPAMLADFARQFRTCAEQGRGFAMIDLTTPEKRGTVTVTAMDTARLAVQVAEVAEQARAAWQATERDDAAEAIAIWRNLLEPPARVPGQRIIPRSGQLHGTQQLSPLTHHGPDGAAEDLRKTMAGCRWLFAADGRCLLVPGPAGWVRDDLYPLPGRWAPDGETLKLVCSRPGMGETSYTLTGIITEVAGRTLLDATIEFDGKYQARQWHRTSRFEQVLSDAQIARADPPDGVAGLLLLATDPLTPSMIYTVSVAGHDGVRPFPPVRTELVFRQPPSADRAPLTFTLGIGAEDVIGNITWLSHLGDSEYDTAITVADDRLVADYSYAGLPVAVAWLAGSQPSLPASPAFATSARIAVRFTDGDVHGTVQASGTRQGRPLRYSATISGYRLRPKLPLDPRFWPAMGDPGC